MTNAERIKSNNDKLQDALSLAENLPDVPVPEEYFRPAGTKKITANGTGIDVAQYEKVDVDVPIPEGYVPEGTIPDGYVPEGTVPDGYVPEGTIPDGYVPEGEIPEGYVKPEGELIITENNKTYDVTDKKTAVVQIPSSGGAMDINGVIKQYEVNAGASVSAGDFVEFVNKYGSGYFGSTTPNNLMACKVSNNDVLVVYSYSGKTYGVVLQINADGYISIGAQKTIATDGAMHNITLSLLSENLVFLGGYGGKAKVLEIADGTISVKIVTENYRYGAVALDEHTVLSTLYTSSMTSSSGTITVLEVGDAVTPKYSVSNTNGAETDTRGTKLTDKKAIFTSRWYKYNEPEDVGIWAVAYEDETISVGGKVYLGEAMYPGKVRVAPLTDRLVIAVFTDADVPYASVIGVGGVTCTIKSKNKIAEKATNISACALSSDKVLITYNDTDNSYHGTAVVAVTDGTSLTFGTPVVFDDGTVYNTEVTALSESSALVAYNQGGGGCYKTLLVGGMTISVADGQTGGTFVQPATSTLHNVGVAKTAGTAGETIDVYCVQ